MKVHVDSGNAGCMAADQPDLYRYRAFCFEVSLHKALVLILIITGRQRSQIVVTGMVLA